MFSWIEQPQHKYLKDLYKASATILAFVNLVMLVSDITVTLYIDLQQYQLLFSIKFP